MEQDTNIYDKITGSEFLEIIKKFEKDESSVQDIYKPLLNELKRITLSDVIKHPDEQYIKKLKVAIVALAHQGWYLSMEMPPRFYFEYADLLSKNKEKLDNEIMLFYSDNSNKIKNDLCEKYPHRSDIIIDAFQAHDEGKYNLSIPVMMSQSDGICCEITNKELYSAPNGVPKTKEYVKMLDEPYFSLALLCPFCYKFPMTFNPSERKKEKDKDFLNRHVIIHGENYNYGSEINSLKTISMLDYVATILYKDK